MHRQLWGAITLTLVLLTGPAAAQDRSIYTPAQIALFDRPHLENITQPATLTYRFSYLGPKEQSFDDQVTMAVTAIAADGSKDLQFQYLTGERQQPYGDLRGFRGNPLIMLFLQSDVTEMGRLTGGGAGYLRNRIRIAFLENAKLEQSQIEYDGRQVAAERIVIKPFITDPHRDQMGALADKSYEFLLAPDIPGGLYRIRARIPAGIDGSPAIESSLTYAGSGT